MCCIIIYFYSNTWCTHACKHMCVHDIIEVDTLAWIVKTLCVGAYIKLPTEFRQKHEIFRSNDVKLPVLSRCVLFIFIITRSIVNRVTTLKGVRTVVFVNLSESTHSHIRHLWCRCVLMCGWRRFQNRCFQLSPSCDSSVVTNQCFKEIVPS